MPNTKFIHAAFCVTRIIYGLAQISLSLIVQASYMMSLTKEHITTIPYDMGFLLSIIVCIFAVDGFSTSKRESLISEKPCVRNAKLDVQLGYSLTC